MAYEDSQNVGPVEAMDDWSHEASDQDDQVSDFADGVEEVIVDGDGKPYTPEAGIDEEATEQTPQKQEAQGQNPADADPLTADFYVNGEFDADKAIDFLGIGKEQPAQQQQVQQPVPPTPPQQPVQEPQQPVDELEQIKQTRLGWIDKVNQAIQNGERDLYKVLNDIATREQAEVAEMINQRRFEKAQETYTQQMKAFEERIAAEKMEPQANSNLQTLANELKLSGADKAKALFFDPNYGGRHLQQLFDFVSQFKPEWKGAKGEAAAEAWKQFVVHYTSDMDRVRAFGDFAMAQVQKKTLPELLKRARGIGRSQEQASTRASNKGSNLQGRRASQPQKAEGDVISNWLNGPDERVQGVARL